MIGAMMTRRPRRMHSAVFEAKGLENDFLEGALIKSGMLSAKR